MEEPELYPEDNLLIPPYPANWIPAKQRYAFLWISLALIGLLLVIFVSLLIVISKTKVSIEDQGTNITANFQTITDEVERARYELSQAINFIEEIGDQISKDVHQMAQDISKIVHHIPSK